MQLYSVASDLDLSDIEKLLKRRLASREAEGIPVTVEHSKGFPACVTVGIENERELAALAFAITDVLLLDLRYSSYAEMIERYRLDEAEKKKLFLKVAEADRAFEYEPEYALNMIRYLKENSRIDLGGYYDFRLRKEKIRRSELIDDCLAELESGSEEFRKSELYVVLNPDGSTTITDKDEFFKIVCAPDSDDGVEAIILGLDPAAVTLFDFSFGVKKSLRERIEKLFGGR
ncbi:MAG: hypothetical protein IJM18_10115 [Clostridia bacterium]|nr:hypothetical protein [Clostridia bacterium]